MSYTVMEMLKNIAEYVDGSGVSVETDAGRSLALRCYNRMIEELMYEDRWQGTVGSLRFPVRQGMFWVPPCVQGVRSCSIDGNPAPIRPDSWQFLRNGPGERCVRGAEIRDLGDGYATGVDLPVAMRLSAWSDHPEDVDAYVHFTDNCAGFFSGQVPGLVQRAGERIHLVCAVGEAAQPAAVTEHTWSIGPKSINKPVTRGTVYVCGVSLGGDPFWLATLRPNQTSSSYRRYQLMDQRHEMTSASVLADCDLRYVEAVFDDEVSLIQNPAALRICAQAFSMRDNGDPAGYQAYKGMAISKLMKQLEKESAGQTFRVAFNTQRAGSAIQSMGRPTGFYPNFGRRRFHS